MVDPATWLAGIGTVKPGIVMPPGWVAIPSGKREVPLPRPVNKHAIGTPYRHAKGTPLMCG